METWGLEMLGCGRFEALFGGQCSSERPGGSP